MFHITEIARVYCHWLLHARKPTPIPSSGFICDGSDGAMLLSDVGWCEDGLPPRGRLLNRDLVHTPLPPRQEARDVAKIIIVVIGVVALDDFTPTY